MHLYNGTICGGFSLIQLWRIQHRLCGNDRGCKALWVDANVPARSSDVESAWTRIGGRNPAGKAGALGTGPPSLPKHCSTDRLRLSRAKPSRWYSAALPGSMGKTVSLSL